MMESRNLQPEQAEELLATLGARFRKHMERHEGIEWQDVQARLEAHPDKLWSLHEMERTGGEPDVMGKVIRPNNEYTPASFELRGYDFVGGYGLQLRWQDGHSTGIYSFDYLRRLAGG